MMELHGFLVQEIPLHSRQSSTRNETDAYKARKYLNGWPEEKLH